MSQEANEEQYTPSDAAMLGLFVARTVEFVLTVGGVLTLDASSGEAVHVTVTLPDKTTYIATSPNWVRALHDATAFSREETDA